MPRNHHLFHYFHSLGLDHALQEEPRDCMAEKDAPAPSMPAQNDSLPAPRPSLSFLPPHLSSSTPLSSSSPLSSSGLTRGSSTNSDLDPRIKSEGDKKERDGDRYGNGAGTLAPSPTPPRRSITPADHPAYACKTLAELHHAVEAFEGCELKTTAINTVFCDGNPDADVMLIGEAPGAEEDAQGKPFVGMSGQLLDRMLGAIGLDRRTVYIANIVPWRPPGNRTPSTQEIALCQPFIEQHIYLKKPKFLMLLGGVATKTILNNNTGIMRLRGQWQGYTPPVPAVQNDTAQGKEFLPIRTLPTFHPAFLLRSPNQKVYAWEDLKALKAAIAGEG